ncbi:MAG TPA: MFS transporter [Solirubrobacterales bacterium]|nr:MFS transporter [Solirubrobacterales bacterium]
MRQGPLAGRYPAVAAMVLLALIPYLALSAALGPITPFIASSLHASTQTMSLSGGLSNAAYAVGTVLAVSFAQHYPQRRMMVGYAVLLVIGSILAAGAQDIEMYMVGHVIQGLCTSLLLIAAVPPLALGYPIAKLKTTAVIMNMCIFGAVALGPTIGGLQAQAEAWRPLFWVTAAVAFGALILAILTFEDAPPADPESPRDPLAIGLAAVGCVAAFFGSSQLATHAFLDPIAIIPLIGGLAVIVILIVYQATAKNPLLTIREMLGSSVPVAGIVLALLAAAASVSATDLTAGVLAEHYGALHVGLLYLPELGGAILTAVILGRVITKKSLSYLPLAGMGFLAVGIAVFRIEVPSSEALTLLGSFLTGIGLGATVAPALFVAGFSLRATNLQRVFAIVELLRAVAAFMIAPIFIHFAATVGGSEVAGTSIALWIGLGLAILGGTIPVVIYWLSGARPEKPDLEGFLAGEGAAWYSPPLLARIRSSVGRGKGRGQAVTEGGS